jgi:hypothetical protein
LKYTQKDGSYRVGIDAFQETAINITPCNALHIISGVCIISVFLGGHQAYQMKLHEDGKASGKEITVLKCCRNMLLQYGYED